MQLLVLRPDYHSSSVLENLQKHIHLPNSKRVMQLPHIPLLAYENTAPSHLRAALDPVLQNIVSFTLSAADIGFSKGSARFYMQVHPTDSLQELYRAVHLATQQFLADPRPNDLWQPLLPLIDQVQAPFWGPLFARLALESAPLKGTIAAVECWSVIDGRSTIEWSIFLDS